MTWLQTYRGRRFDLLDPRPEDLDIGDIAHALSNLCRFTGHVRDFYSVAQHSVVVSHLVPAELALVGLMHDATEAYIGDVSRPLKRMLPEYGVIEDRLWAVIAERFGLPRVLPPEVKQADNLALMWERRDLLGLPAASWGEVEDLAPLAPTTPLTPLWSEAAESHWLARFHELAGDSA